MFYFLQQALAKELVKLLAKEPVKELAGTLAQEPQME
jgi:hypothetical protein